MKVLYMVVKAGLPEMKTYASSLCMQLNKTTPARHMEYLYIYWSFCEVKLHTVILVNWR